MRSETVLVVDAPPAVRAAFVRQTATRLACAAVAFAVSLSLLLILLPSGVVVGWMRAAPLAVVLPAVSLTAAWAARWWAETERGRPLAVLGLHAVLQAVVLAPLLVVALDCFGAWMALPIGLALASMLLAVGRVMRFSLPQQTAAAALALSAAGADPVWYVGRLAWCVASCRD